MKPLSAVDVRAEAPRVRKLATLKTSFVSSCVREAILHVQHQAVRSASLVRSEGCPFLLRFGLFVGGQL